MSINGLDPAQNEYMITIHVLSSMAGSQRLFEIAGLSTITVHALSGIQIAGVVNGVGGVLLAWSQQRAKKVDAKWRIYHQHSSNKIAEVFNLI